MRVTRVWGVIGDGDGVGSRGLDPSPFGEKPPLGCLRGFYRALQT